MIQNTLAGGFTLCGVGLCAIGGAMMLQAGSPAFARPGSTPTTTLPIATATHPRDAPTVVWYGVAPATGALGTSLAFIDRLYRAWSDGTVELKKLDWASDGCDSSIWCSGMWVEVSTAADGFRAAADLNSDEQVDAVDLASVISNWGDAPRVPFPTSDCPLDLINP